MKVKVLIVYSQNNEESHILNKVGNKTNGIFLDIGAFDGKWASNTLALVERGWSGICIEGSPFSFSKLFVEHKNRPDILLLNAIVSHEPVGNDRIVRFWESPNSAASTINQQNYDKWKDRIRGEGYDSFKEMFVPKVSIDEVLSWAKTHYPQIDFVSIDVEGGSVDLALKFDPDAFGTSLLCVEHDGRYVELANHFAKKGFYPVSNNAENMILHRNY